MQQYYRTQNTDLDELGCPKNVVLSKMQTGEIVTLMLGIFAILMTITIVVYYRYYQYSTSRTVKMHQRHYVPR
uniref:SRCR domain-containing protein n=1 Tax=Steinernema glaseri TaxID=37863 RepID=A0A1I7YQT5_9BILA